MFCTWAPHQCIFSTTLSFSNSVLYMLCVAACGQSSSLCQQSSVFFNLSCFLFAAAAFTVCSELRSVSRLSPSGLFASLRTSLQQSVTSLSPVYLVEWRHQGHRHSVSNLRCQPTFSLLPFSNTMNPCQATWLLTCCSEWPLTSVWWQDR